MATVIKRAERHNNSLTSRWCCLCSGETKGTPIQNCKYCKEAAE